MFLVVEKAIVVVASGWCLLLMWFLLMRKLLLRRQFLLSLTDLFSTCCFLLGVEWDLHSHGHLSGLLLVKSHASTYVPSLDKEHTF
jgi:hypothetical protein